VVYSDSDLEILRRKRVRGTKKEQSSSTTAPLPRLSSTASTSAATPSGPANASREVYAARGRGTPDQPSGEPSSDEEQILLPTSKLLPPRISAPSINRDTRTLTPVRNTQRRRRSESSDAITTEDEDAVLFVSPHPNARHIHKRPRRDESPPTVRANMADIDAGTKQAAYEASGILFAMSTRPRRNTDSTISLQSEPSGSLPLVSHPTPVTSIITDNRLASLDIPDSKCFCGLGAIPPPVDIDWARIGVSPAPITDIPFLCRLCKLNHVHH
jgi:hypothetical protein